MSASVLDFDAFIIDLDGVITDTASLHARAWKSVLDGFMNGERLRGALAPFHLTADYARYVHGRTQAEAIRTFLASRNIELREGEPGDIGSAQTIRGLARRKSELFRQLVEERGVRVFEGSRQFLDRLRLLSRATALVTTSRNGELVLDRAGLGRCFDVVIDGRMLERERLADQPGYASLHFAAAWLGKKPEWTAVIEATSAGVAAGRQGNFGCVIGVLRGNSEAALRAAGADLVVADLAQLLPAATKTC